MKTEDLVELLSTDIEPVKKNALALLLMGSVLAALAGAFVIMVTVFGIRPDLASVIATPIFWEKLAFPLSLSVGAVIATSRLGRPGASIGAGWAFLILPVACVWVAGAAVVYGAAPADRALALLGHTWRSCPFNILLLSIPGFIAIFYAMAKLAPTRLRLAGAASGMLAGTLATVAYCFHCPEMSPAFWSIWYLLGMMIASSIGALLAPRLLRW
ncbi:DUF1109 domain-containing protein [Dyella flava]|uniref:DUF1109 domain-containing protein n=1 Tax=Dyella flava TaxID=1920170 RepID=A0ABS2JZN6_9GAMM|nr:DUF1109 domain-containing protein [Dyella flava]MBM7124469.1 DUF1109 domain-containing protein [Dyella flava]GLQ51869.1 hypothetical protein GCM10010872_33180 [Dyella flava]